MGILLSFLAAVIVGICLVYFRNLAMAGILLALLGLIFFLERTKKRALCLGLGLVFGLAASLYYLGKELPHNYNYVNLIYEGKQGIAHQFLFEGRRIGVSFPYGEGENLKVGNCYCLESRWQKMPPQADGRIYFGAQAKIKASYPPDSLRSFVEEMKGKWAVWYEEVIGVEGGAMAGSLILGTKSAYLKASQDRLKSLGIIHILSISGFHVNLLEGLFKKLRLGKLSFPLILAYAFLVNSVPGWRAAFMKGHQVLGQVFKRDSDSRSQLAFSALLLLIPRPYLLFQPSFQLSFLATAGLAALAKPLKEGLKNLPLGEALALSLSATIPCLPVLAGISHRFDLVMFPANILVVPFYGGLCGVAFFLLGIFILEPIWAFLPIYLPLGQLLSSLYNLCRCCAVLLEYVLYRFFSLPLAWSGWILWYWLPLWAILLRGRRVSLLRKAASLLLALVTIVSFSILPGTTRITYLKKFGQARLLLRSMFSQAEIYTEKMAFCAPRDGVILEDPCQVFGLDLEPAEGDFVKVLIRGKPLMPQGSDIIEEEYIKWGDALIRVK